MEEVDGLAMSWVGVVVSVRGCAGCKVRSTPMSHLIYVRSGSSDSEAGTRGRIWWKTESEIDR